jgi:hypothetical protein
LTPLSRSHILAAMQEQASRPAGQPSGFKEFFVTWRGIIFNALFLAYILVVQKPFLSLVRESADMGRRNVPLGIFIVGLMLVQLAALFIKLPAVIRRTGVSDARQIPRGGWVMVLPWATQIALSIFLIYVGLPALGIPGVGWAFLGTAIVFAKDFFLIMSLALGSLKVKYKVSRLLEYSADAALFFFGLFAYTATWVYWSEKLRSETIPGVSGPSIVSFLLGLIIFLFCFPAIQGPYIQEVMSLPRTRVNRASFWLFWGMLAANILSAMLTFVFGK